MKYGFLAKAALWSLILSTPCAYALPSVAEKTVEELALPAVPADVTGPMDRADYILAHFWDSMDFSDAARARDRAFMEQNLVNFFSVMPHASASGLSAGVDALMSRASADVESYKLILELAEHYLYEFGSPMRDQELFIPFLNNVLASEVLSSSELIRPKYLLGEALLNRVGTEASDFDMTLRDGSSVKMRGFTAGKSTLLMFYDPDCDHCAETVAELQADSTFGDLVESGRLNVLAVYPFGEEDVWTGDSMVKIPAGWTDAFADLSEVDLYGFPEMPVLYLLDKDGKVLMKEAYLSQVIDRLHLL